MAKKVMAKGAVVQGGVVVVGSLNMDLVVKTEVIPVAGQTVLGQDVAESPGGKGANQAVAAGQLGKTGMCRMIGRVGDDVFGRRLVENLKEAGVESGSVLVTKKAPSGVAMIVVDRHGENSIVVAGGANQRLSVADLLVHRGAIEKSKAILIQLEVPYETVACAIALAKQAGVVTILDPAPVPAEGMPESLYHVDILTPNQVEAHLLTGVVVRTAEDAKRAGAMILARGTATAIIKMGALGAVVVMREKEAVVWQHVAGFRAAVVDTTGAGDAFNGALAVGIGEGMGMVEAVRFANAAGALACGKAGAQAGMPGRAEVEALVRKGKG